MVRNFENVPGGLNRFSEWADFVQFQPKVLNEVPLAGALAKRATKPDENTGDIGNKLS